MQTKTVVVLGCGRIGSVIVRDLARDKDLRVVAADQDRRHLQQFSAMPRIETSQVDLTSADAVGKMAKNADAVVGALPSRLGFGALQAVIQTGTPICDISFMAEDALRLHDLAVEQSVTAVVDCGVAPGLSNLAVGNAQAHFERLHSVAIYVGGLPRERRWPYEYAAPFAPSDVIEEYTRPVRLRRNGREVVAEALSEGELLAFPGVGTLEAFLTDGLRSLLTTIDAPDMLEKTMRYPGHAELMRVFKHTGFFDPEPVQVGEVRISPLALTSQLLSRCWTPDEAEAEFTVLRVVVEGDLNGQRHRRQVDLFEESDPQSGTSSMASTTGMPAAIVTRMLLRGAFDQPGVFPPEILGKQSEIWDHILSELEARGLTLTVSEQAV